MADKTISERLDAILDQVLPKGAPRNPSPYRFGPTADGKIVLTIAIGDTGELIAATGATNADAVVAMEARLAR